MALGSVGRSISIALSLATQGFNAGLNSASANLNNFAAGSNQSLQKVATAAGITSAALVAGFGIAVNAAMGFESAMSEVAAVSGATGAQFDALRDQALKLGADTAFSATEVAKAQAELIKAGVSTADVMGGALKGSLDLAASAGLDVAQAAEITSNVLNTFELSGREASHVADVLAASANKSAADVSDMALAMKQAGTAANLTGMDLEETAGALSIFANAGVKGSDAGTSLRTMLLRLNPTTAEAKATMEKYGLSFVDQQGNFVDMADVAEQLQTKMSKLGEAQRAQALQTIFGQDAIRAATLLFQQGGEGVDYWTSEVDDAGYAAEVARIRMDNLSGDLEKLGGSIDTVLIQAGSEANGVMRMMAQTGTDVVNGIGGMPDGFSQIGIGATMLTIGVTAATAGLGTFIPMARNVKGALDGMGGAWSSVAGTMTMRNFAAIAGGVAVVGGAFILVTSQIEGAKRRAKEANDVFRASLETPTDLAGFVSYADAVDAELGRLTTRLDTVGISTETGFGRVGRLMQEFGENLIPFGNDAVAETEQRIKDLIDTQHEAASSGIAYATVVKEIGDRYGWTTTQVEEFARKNGVDIAGSATSAVAILAEEKEAVALVNGQLALTPAAAEAVSGALNNELNPALDAAVEAASLAPPVVTDVSDGMLVLGDSATSTTEKIDALKTIIDAFLGIALDEGGAQDKLQGELNGIRQAAIDASWNLTGVSDSSIAFRDQMRGAAEAAGSLIQAWIDQGVKGDELRGRVEGLSQSMYDQAIAAGVPKVEVDKYFGALNQLPAEVYTNFDTSAVPGAINDVGQLNSALDAVERERYARIHIETFGANVGSMVGSMIVGSANGNIFTADGALMAFANGGHHMPQIANAGSAMRLWNEPAAGGESYIPHAQSKRGRAVDILRQTNQMLGSPIGSGGTTVVNVSVQASAPNYLGSIQDVGRALGDIVSRDPRLAEQIGTAVVRASGARDGAR